MPIYAYRCPACSLQFEVLVRARAAEPERCEECGASGIERAVTAFAITHSDLEQMRSLDPKYKGMVDDLMDSTPEADPMRLLDRLTPLDAAEDPGDPIDF